MKNIILYIGLLALVLLIPVDGIDVADLQPVQTVVLYREDEKITLATDTGDIGAGEDSLQALQELKATTPGIIYLDTADYLLVSEEVLAQVNALRDHLKSSVEIYCFRGQIDPKAVSKFLSVHGNGPKLKQWNEAMPLPVLTTENDRIIFLEKSKNST